MHLLVDPRRTVEEIHTVCDQIEEEIGEQLVGVTITIHLEPDDGRYRGPLDRILRERS
jgi:divalent metal cation (Fe/Co/Zn/Cd) transporter